VDGGRNRSKPATCDTSTNIIRVATSAKASWGGIYEEASSRTNIGVFLVLACGGDAETQTRKVRVAIPGYAISTSAFLISKLNGYYVEEGLDVELIAMRAQTTNLALLAGNVEFGTVPVAGLTTALQGASLKVIFCSFDKPQHVLFSKSEIRDLKALRGKKIAISGLRSLDDILLQESLKTEGMDGGRDVTVVSTGSPDTRLAALASGSVDAAVLIAPFSFKAKEMAFNELLVFMKHGFALPSGGIVVQDNLLRTDPVTVEKFVRGTLKGFIFLRDSRAGAIRVLSQILKVDNTIATRIYDSARPTMAPEGALSEEAQKKTIDFIVKLAGAKDSVAYSRFFDFSWVRQASKELQSGGWKPGS
jgi:ABC-type nitrate/sulfonate/bicarbonate transport system substrate-binding protein